MGSMVKRVAVTVLLGGLAFLGACRSPGACVSTAPVPSRLAPGVFEYQIPDGDPGCARQRPPAAPLPGSAGARAGGDRRSAWAMPREVAKAEPGELARATPGGIAKVKPREVAKAEPVGRRASLLGPRWRTDFRGLVEGWSKLPPASRNAEALRVALQVEMGNGRFGPPSIHDLIKELVAQEQDGVLEYLDRNLPEGGGDGRFRRKDVLHIVIASAGLRVSMQPLIGVLAERNLMSIRLAGYRPGGISYLLGVLEEAELGVDIRVSCADYLGMHAGPDVLPRMRRLAGDQTRVYAENMNPFGKDTLGQHVTEAIESIEARERYRAARKRESDD